MKLEEITRQQHHKDGTYFGVRFTHDTKQNLSKYIKRNKIPNPIDPEEFHTTVVYSRKALPNVRSWGVVTPMITGKPNKFEVWKSHDGDNHVLVLKYDCQALTDRHNFLVNEFGATHDFEEYIPHITLSYDVGEDFDVGKLKKFKHEIGIEREYSQPLDLDWKKNNTD